MPFRSTTRASRARSGCSSAACTSRSTASSAPAPSRPCIAFQSAHGLSADGVVGSGTWNALGLPGHHPLLKRGRKPHFHHTRRTERHAATHHGHTKTRNAPHALVRLLQRHLHVATDGVFGPGTKAAVEPSRAHTT